MDNWGTIKILKHGTEVYCIVNDNPVKGKIDERRVFQDDIIGYCIKVEGKTSRSWKGAHEVFLTEKELIRYIESRF